MKIYACFLLVMSVMIIQVACTQNLSNQVNRKIVKLAQIDTEKNDKKREHIIKQYTQSLAVHEQRIKK